MAPRKHRRVHYSDFIHGPSSSSASAGGSTSSSVPETYSQTAPPQTAPPETFPEPQPDEPIDPPPVPGVGHPDLMVPPDVPYAQYRVEDILQNANRGGLPVLHIDRPAGTYWFGVDNKVGRSITDCIKSFFVEATPNWRSTPHYIRVTWFKIFAQRWNWDVSITETVKYQFNQKAMKRLSNTVSDWKTEWELKGDDGKPSFMTHAVWEGLKNYWTEPNSVKKSAQCSASRTTVGPDGLPVAMPHTAGQTPFGGVAIQMAEDLGHVPSLPDLFKRTHQRKSGVFIDARSERLHNEVVAAVQERQTQLSQQSSDGAPVELSTSEVDAIYRQIAPKKKGRILGIGSAQDIPRVTSSWVGENSLRDELIASRNEISELQRAQAEQQRAQAEQQRATNEQFAAMESMFDILVAGNPHAAEALERRRQNMRPSTQTENVDLNERISEEQEARSTDLFHEILR